MNEAQSSVGRKMRKLDRGEKGKAKNEKRETQERSKKRGDGYMNGEWEWLVAMFRDGRGIK